jgi:enoyl-CoA hydratase/carnithine racemase
VVAELTQSFTRAGKSNSLRAIVLQSTGSVFSAGHDLSEMAGKDETFYRNVFENCSRMMGMIRTLPQPVIAKVHGLATAAGCQLVAACDLVVASEQSRFATPGVKIGLFCTTPMVPLIRSIHPKVAMEMLLTGQPISASRAYDIGLVNRVVSEADLESATSELVAAVLATSSATIALGKRAFYRQLPLPEPQAYEDANQVMVENILIPDAQEGINAFLEKRKPNW